MTDQNREAPDLLDIPIMPTGSGVADLEIARELDAIAAGAVMPDGEEADIAPATGFDAVGIEQSGPNDAGVTASGAE